MSTEDTTSPSSTASACPVDHKSREAWLKAAQQQQQSTASTPTSSSATSSPAKRPKFTDQRTLSNDRQVSSIPRGSFTTPTAVATTTQPSTSGTAQDAATTETAIAAATASHGSSSADSPNAETSNPTTSSSGHWLYPSEAQFFQAVIRKHGAPSPSTSSTAPQASSTREAGAGTSAQPADMKTIIPLHNAINERTWQQILSWERGRGGERCGGPKLVSFSGDSTKLTPRARWLGLLGYTRPFDRHDWVVERCGLRVEYVIDFYQGRSGSGSGWVPGSGSGPGGEAKKEGGINFYLDVRPKLNSWEGWKMRAGRLFGY